MKTVITYGTFDLFHVGHVRLLKRMSAFGDRLVVGCSTDEFNLLKGKTSIFSYAERTEILRACTYVNEVFPEANWEQKVDDIKKHSADVLVMGDDWAGKFDFLQHHLDVVYLPRTDGISSTHVKQVVSKLHEEKKMGLINAIEVLLDTARRL